MHKPELLKLTNKVGIISTARKISKQEIQPAIDRLQRWGLEPILGKHLFAEHHQFAGTTDQRVADLQEMLDNPEIKAVFCARGGYGTVQLIDKIDFSGFRQHPKWVIGYSDVTVLHSHINRYCEVETLHATMPINFPKTARDDNALESLYNALFYGDNEYRIKHHPFNKKGVAQGQLVGGNLSILNSLLGSPSDVNTIGKILFIEDLDEYLYHIDRMMMNMKRNGKFDHIRALLVGGMSDMNDNEIPFGKTAEEIIIDVLGDVTFPILFNVPAGHIDDNRTLNIGGNTMVEVNDRMDSRIIQE
ncbi:MAG: LD-carboxypeptidase [Bacteroidales bacterium]|nr:LD-carboxypeptidase [Bacteroidales bacterium]